MQPSSSTAILSPKFWGRRLSIGIIFNVGLAVFGVVIARLLGSATQVVLARMMGVTTFGLYTTLYTLLGPVAIVTGFGLDTWLLRQGGERASLETAIGQVLLLRLLTTGSVMLVVVAGLVAVGWSNFALPIALAALGLTCELLLATGTIALRAQLRNRPATLLQVIVAILTITLIWFFWTARAPLLTAASYRLLADLVGVGVLVWLLKRSLHTMSVKSIPVVYMLKQSRAYFAADLLSSVALRGDLTMVALMLGPLAAGLYSPALTIVNTTFVIPGIAWQVLVPILTRQPAGSRGFRRIMGLAVAGSVLYGLLWAGVLGWYSGPIIDLVFRAQYRDAVPLLQIMSLIPLMKSLNFCWAMLMVVRDNQVLRTKILALGSVFNVVVNLVCIPLFGLVGAARVNLATEIVLLIGYSYGAWRSMHKPI